MKKQSIKFTRPDICDNSDGHHLIKENNICSHYMKIAFPTLYFSVQYISFMKNYCAVHFLCCTFFESFACMFWHLICTKYFDVTQIITFIFCFYIITGINITNILLHFHYALVDNTSPLLSLLFGIISCVPQKCCIKLRLL